MRARKRAGELPQMKHVRIVTLMSHWPGVRTTAIALILAGSGLALSGAAPAAGRQVVRPTLATAQAATAATTWSVGPAGSFSGSGGPVTLTDATTGTVLTCKSSAISGSLKSGRGLPGAGIGSFTSVTFKSCLGPGGKTFTVTASASTGSPWVLNALSYDATTLAATVTISSVMASISGTGCNATVAGATATTPGTIGGTYTNNVFTPTLGLNPTGGTLHTWNVSGCSGLFSGGDGLTVAVTYSIATGQVVVPTSCPPFPVQTGFPFNPHLKLPPYPPGSQITFPVPPNQACAFIKGFSNVQKLNEAALVGPGFGNLQDGRRIVRKITPNPGYYQLDSSGQLYFKPCPGSAPQCRPINGLPPVHATFLSFGFMPTMATLQITQIGSLNIASVSTNTTLKYSEVESLASIQIKSVLVNGVPLNVGSGCRTISPFKLVLIGKPPYQLQTGGVLAGMINIPPFTGCGVGENLDSIFTGSVSGPGNYIQLTQGNLCADWPVPPIPSGCPATVPKPVH
jgi:hypothetical protein